MKKTTMFLGVLVCLAVLSMTASAKYLPAECWGGHLNPGQDGTIYPGSDHCGFTNGNSEMGSPAYEMFLADNPTSFGLPGN